MGAAPVQGAMPLQPHGFIVTQGVENRLQQAAVRAGLVPEPIEHELGDRVSRTTRDFLSTVRWRETVGWGKSSTICRSETKSGAAARQFTMRNRVGSARVSSSSVGGSGVICADTYIRPSE
jgi:hypothetical protein